MVNQTLEQRRALYALRTIQKHTQDDEKVKKRYATLVRSLPVMVLQNGLGQALAYLLADAEGKDAPPANRLYVELQDWLCGPVSDEWPERVYQDGPKLIEALMAGSHSEYRRAQQNALAFLAWMRKFADAYLPEGE